MKFLTSFAVIAIMLLLATSSAANDFISRTRRSLRTVGSPDAAMTRTRQRHQRSAAAVSQSDISDVVASSRRTICSLEPVAGPFALPSFVGITTRPRSSARRLPTVVVVATRTTSPAKCVACATALPSQPSRGDAVKFCRLTTSKCGHFTRFHTADPTVRPLNLYFRLTRWWRLINDAKQYKLLMLSWARTNEIVCARQIIAKCP